MVVHNLYNYLWTNIPSQTVSLEELAEERKANGSPILVADGKNVVCHILTKYHEGKMHEMRWSHYVDIAKSFVEKMADINIRLVLYFGKGDGEGSEVNTRERRINPRIRTKFLNEAELISEIFRSLRNGDYPECSHFPPGIVAAYRYIFQYECDSTVYCTRSDINREIARYAATTPDCFAILSADASHLIFETKPLLSTINFDADTFQTTMFLRSELHRVSKLRLRDFPLLACMAGNDVISPGDLRNFHNRLSPEMGGKDRNIIKKIVKYIHKNKWGYEDISNIARGLGIAKELLEKGIEYYNISTNDDNFEADTSDALTELTNKCVHCRASNTLFPILRFRKFKQGKTLEDPQGVPQSAHIYKCIRQRMYHVLFEQQPVDIEEWCVCQNEEPTHPESVSSIQFEIDVDIPSISDLLSEQVEPEIRWKLFCACLGIRISARDLQLIENRYIVLCSLLNFLLHNEDVQLEAFEVKAFICQALVINSDNDVIPAKVMTECRAVSLAGIFWRGIWLLQCVVPVCGYPFPFEDIMPWKYFEGVVFYRCYNLLKKDAVVDPVLNNDVEALNTFRKLYRIAVMGTHLG